MKKIYAIAAMLGIGAMTQAQEQQMTSEYGSGSLPPSISKLFKFDDVPVSLYTGVPDVSIPLLSLPTRSRDISIGMAYSYHPASGWNINYGGAITRVIENSESLFKTNEFGFANNTRFASDVYKFNFMGHSGSFFLKKEADNTLVPSVLVNKGQSLKIDVDYNPATYFVNSFTVYDAKGYKFVFGVYDKNITAYAEDPTPKETRVSFRLTAIYDNNGQKLAGIAYTEKFKQEPGSGKKEYTNITALVQSEGFGKAQFVYSPLDDGTKVDEITLSDLNSNVIRRIDFREANKLIFRDTAQNKNEEYLFYYSDGIYGSYDTSQGILTTDRFGSPSYIPYYLYEDSYQDQESYLKNAVNPNVITRDVLEKIGLPTGGSILYEYESNTYSFYQGESISTMLSGSTLQEDPDFYYSYYPYADTYPYNHIVEDIARGWIGTAPSFFTISGGPKTVYISVRPDKYFSDLSLAWTYSQAHLSGPGISQPLYRPYNLENMGIGKPFTLASGSHQISLGPFGYTHSAYRTISTMSRNPAVKKWKYGGGRRIKRIAYFDTDVPADLLRKGDLFYPQQYKPAKETSYSYNLFDEPNRSSGNLVADSQMNFSDKYGQMEFVGYRNVTVTESGNNGKTQYTFSTSADYPLGIDQTVSASHSKDYKRGLLKNKKAYDSSNVLVQNTDYAYLFFDENDQVNYFDDKVVRDRTGKSRPASETTTLYQADSAPVVTSTQYSYYDDANRSLESKTVSSSAGETLKTKYYYHSGNSPLSKNRIAEIEKVEEYRNGSLVSTTKTAYANTWPGNVSWLPQAIQSSKGANPLETKIRFNAYDEYGNLQEMQQENGTKTSYVWGYGKTQVAAKIENMAYAGVPPALIADIQTATASGTEAAVLQKLELLRGNATLAGAMTTAYTHRPLVGVSTITDPKGDKASYEYDSFGRLKAVKDRNAKLVSENEYHYRTALPDQNYTKTTAYKVETAASLSAPSAAQAAVQIAYFDGLGRSIQQRAHRQSGSGKDIVTHIEYDASSRQAKGFLAYPSASATLAYDASAAAAVAAYYASPPSPSVSGFETTGNPYSETLFEASPLGRVLKQAAPGDAWAMGSGHEIRTSYLSNSAADNVRLLRAQSSWDAAQGLYVPAFYASGIYDKGELYKTVLKDENWTAGNSHTVQEFKNKDGKVVLKRAWGSSIVNNAPAEGWHDTYYVYDQFGNLSFVLPPLSDGSGSAQDLDGLCYQYRYDRRNRLAEKKLPGKAWEFIIYDTLDRVIATGPVLSPFGSGETGWLFTKYDAFARIAYTGWLPAAVTAADRNTLQAARDAQVANLNEAKASSDNTVNGVAFRYTSTAWPASGYHVLGVNYYDDYAFPGAPASFPNVEGEPVYYTLSVKPKGLPTGSWIRVLESATLASGEASYTLYDGKARPVRTWTSNYLGGYSVADTKLDFSGKTLHTVTRHKRGTADTELYVKELFAYTEQDRIETHLHQVGENSNPQLLSKNGYDELGRLTSKRIGGYDISAAAYLQKTDYDYTVRGWLKGINSLEEDADSPLDLFAFKINYDTLENNPNGALSGLYNGNISETFWKSKNDSHVRSYSYAYDAMNRLKNAYYYKNNFASFSYNEGAEYDKNGNITKMARNGDLDSHIFSIQIDDLEYTYGAGNRLLSVQDSSIHPAGFNDGANTAAEYAYDDRGNMVSDANKGIASIIYNHMDLPREIVFANGNKISYLYNANGIRLRKAIDSGSGTAAVTDYLSGFQYTASGKTSKLDFFPTAEGYVKPVSSHGAVSYRYIYNHTDHLGNVRMSYTTEPISGELVIIEENNYYPFGLKHDKYNSDTYAFQEISTGTGYYTGLAIVEPGGRSSYQYKYNGKEFQDEMGLDLYDYGARNYDPAIGRWMNIDPLAESFYNVSPYNYAMNNPVYFIDPDGMSASPIYDYDGNFMGTDDQGFSGEVIFMDQTTFNLHGGYNNGTDDSKKGGISHETAMAYGETINEVIGDDVKNTYTQGDADMINNAITHIVSQMPEVDISQLQNGKVSSSYYEMDNGLPYGKSSNGAQFRDGASADTRRLESGQSRVSFYLDSFLNNEFTVANIQNTMVHEYSGHHKKGIPGSYGPEHAKAIDLQRSHPTWKNTTQNFKDNINYVYKYFMRKN